MFSLITCSTGNIFQKIQKQLCRDPFACIEVKRINFVKPCHCTSMLEYRKVFRLCALHIFCRAFNTHTLINVRYEGIINDISVHATETKRWKTKENYVQPLRH